MKIFGFVSYACLAATFAAVAAGDVSLAVVLSAAAVLCGLFSIGG